MMCPRDLLPQAALAGPFPWIGEAHPLRQRYVRSLYTAASLALFLHLCVFSLWAVPRGGSYVPVIPGRIVQIEWSQPPSNEVHEAPQAVPIVVPKSFEIGIPEPVADFEARTMTLPTEDQINEAFRREATLPRLNPGDSAVFRIPDPEPAVTRGPSEFVPFTVPPALISVPAPAYPEMARQAGLEGVVALKVLVGKDGRVKEAVVTSGAPLLNEAALEAARQAIFRPALEQKHPVEVWVELRMRFSLS